MPDAGDGVDDAAGELLAFAATKGERFPSGYKGIDSLGAIGPGEMGLLCARSGCGKSTYLLNVISRSGAVPTAVFSMEMAARTQVAWLACMTHRLPVAAKDFEQVLAWPDDSRHAECVTALRDMKRYYPSLHFPMLQRPTVDDLVKRTDDIAIRTGVAPRRVFIDHLSLMANTGDYAGATAVTARLHAWAINDDIAVILLQQAGRSGGDGKTRNDGHLPITMSSGLYAGEHDADFYWGLYRPEKNPKYLTPEAQVTPEYQKIKGVTRLQLIKNRPFSELNEVGVGLEYDAYSRRLYARGEKFALPVGAAPDEEDAEEEPF